MRKILGIMSLVIVVMFSFAACNNNTQNENNNSVVENNSGVISGENNGAEENNGGTSSENINIAELFSGEIILEPVNKEFEVTQALNNVESLSGLNETTKMTETEIEESFNFGNFKDLQKEIRSSISEENITEIAIIKIGENEQSMPLFQVMTTRIMNLKDEYKDNEKITNILNNSDSYVLKQQGGILISILAENAKEIETKLQEEF